MITRTAIVGNEEREADYSDDEIYRYRLDIRWDPLLPILTTIALNPSTASELKDDPTIRRCKEYARVMRCGAYRMLNIFAVRSTDYKLLFKSRDPVGPENTLEYLKLWSDGTIKIACWGAHSTERPWRHFYRGREVAAVIDGLYALKITASGHPSHPLYLPADLRPIPFKYDY